MTDNYWNKFVRARISRRRALQAGGMGGAGLAAGLILGCGSDAGDSTSSGGTGSTGGGGTGTAASGSTGSGNLAASQNLIVRYYDDPGGFDPANLFRIEVENIA